MKREKNILVQDQSNFNEISDEIRFKLVWYLCIAIPTALIALGAFNSLIRMRETLIPYLAGAILGYSSLVYMKYRKDYKLVSKIISIGTVLILSLSLILLKNEIHYSTPMWMILSLIFTFFAVNNYWGLGVTVIYMAVMTYYIIFQMGINLHDFEPIKTFDLVKISAVFLVCFLAVAYILYQFVVLNKHTQQALLESNNELKERNSLISKQNNEKDIMVKEIHHRVKNNLQVISSLLRLQMAKTPNEERLLLESVNRVQAMALIHEQLYRNELFIDFNLEEYIQSLAENIKNTYEIEKEIKIRIHSNFNKLEQRTIVPFSLLINELMANSIKHAFRDKEVGSINIQIEGKVLPNFRMTYNDNGIWKGENPNGFGLDLVSSMTEQLEGNYDLKKELTGTTFIFDLQNIQ